MKLELFNSEANKIWRRISESEQRATELLLELEEDIYKKLLIFFQIGDSCYFIFNFQLSQFDFISREIEMMLGYPAKNFTPELFMQLIHIEDRAWFLNCQEAASQFTLALSSEKQMMYKLQFDYRVRKENGDYIRVMHQTIVIQNDEAGQILRALVVLTDITHLKKNGQPVLSYIGMHGEPSYIDVNVRNLFPQENNLLSMREKEVLYLLVEGKLSKEIADALHISKHTVDTHRKNLLRKLRAFNTGELVGKAIRDGWV